MVTNIISVLKTIAAAVLRRGKGVQRKSGSLKKGGTLRRTPSDEQKEQKKYDREKWDAFWQNCIFKLGNVSEVSGRTITKPGPVNYHHVFPKADYPQLKWAMGNILVVTFEEHQHLNDNVAYYEAAVSRRAWVMSHYEQLIKQSQVWSETYDETYKKRRQL